MHKNNKKTILAALLATLLSAQGSAVSLSADGTGQVLLYPYYTANAGQTTVISVVNHTAVGKALRVRVSEGRNGRDAIAFNLYLGAFDMWTAGVFALGEASNQPGNLATLDNSCTVPLIQNNPTLPLLAGGNRYVPFQNSEYTGRNNDSESNDLDRTREGFIEVIEMGSIDPNNATSKYITSVNGVPRNCLAVDASWIPNAANPATGNYGDAALGTNANDIGAPTGGLSGTGAIIDVSDGTYVNYDAVALSQFRSQALHALPSEGRPRLTDADPVSDVLTERGVIHATWRDEPIGVTATQGGRIDAVSSVLASAATMNEFNFDLAQKAKTEWIVSLPTRPFYADFLRTQQTVAIAPFSRALNQVNNLGQVTEAPPTDCEGVNLRRYDRQGQAHADSPFSEAPPAPKRELCYVVNSFSWPSTNNGVSTIFRSRLNRNTGGLPNFLVAGGTTTPYGTAVMDWRSFGNNSLLITPPPPPRRLRKSLEGHQFVGLPVIGFYAMSLENANARPNVIGFYGGAYSHKRERACINDDRARCEGN